MIHLSRKPLRAYKSQLGDDRGKLDALVTDNDIVGGGGARSRLAGTIKAISLLNLRKTNTERSKNSGEPSCSTPTLMPRVHHQTSRSFTKSANVDSLTRFFFSFHRSISFGVRHRRTIYRRFGTCARWRRNALADEVALECFALTAL